MKPFMNPHDILGVEEGADFVTVKKRFRSVSKIFHPDKHQNDPTAVVLFQLIRDAYDKLKNNMHKIELPRIDVTPVEAKDHVDPRVKETGGTAPSVVPPEFDIRILGEKLKDPWFNQDFSLYELFGDVTIPESKQSKPVPSMPLSEKSRILK